MATRSSQGQKRCAIYTRKSSEEGLEQEFNSLDAQRVAGEAYVLSQAGEGWSTLAARYDDGGFSGGSMDRPGLKQLLADITAGRVDVVVVYKVDRLTRSLMDFAKIVERFDAHGVSFVSVTQAFNTTTSMGRLTLNVLLSFAQFEREVTGERIRDKIALSKARGIWMGGMVPLGYDLRDRHLLINEAEAALVRSIFDRYLTLRSVHILWDQLHREGVRSKRWISLGGRSMGGALISRGALFHILNRRLYLGEIEHKGQIHPGRHPPIVERELFDRVQQMLASNQVARRERPRKAAGAVLAGRVFDADGAPMGPSFSYGRRGRTYRYYLALDLQMGRRRLGDDDRLRRVNAEVLEGFVCDCLRRVTGKAELGQDDLRDLVVRIDLRAASTELVLKAEAVLGVGRRGLLLEAMNARLAPGERLVWDDDAATAMRLVLPLRFRMWGGRTWVEGAENLTAARRVNRGLVEALRSAHQELQDLNASPLSSVDNLRGARAPDDQHRRQVSRLAFLAPDLQQMILDGRQPASLKLRTLLKTELPLAWEDQRRWFAALR